MNLEISAKWWILCFISFINVADITHTNVRKQGKINIKRIKDLINFIKNLLKKKSNIPIWLLSCSYNEYKILSDTI